MTDKTKLKDLDLIKDDFLDLSINQNHKEFLAKQMRKYGLTLSDFVNIFLRYVITNEKFSQRTYILNKFKNEEKAENFKISTSQ